MTTLSAARKRPVMLEPNERLDVEKKKTSELHRKDCECASQRHVATDKRSSENIEDEPCVDNLDKEQIGETVAQAELNRRNTSANVKAKSIKATAALAVGAVAIGVVAGSIGWFTAACALFVSVVAVAWNRLPFLRNVVAKVKKPVVRCLQLAAAFSGGALLSIVITTGMGWLIPTAAISLATMAIWKRNGATNFVRAARDTFNDLSFLVLLVMFLLLLVWVLLKSIQL